MQQALAVAVAVRPLTDDDIDAVARIDAVSFRSADDGDVDSSRSQLREELARPWSRMRLARDAAGRVVGFLVAWLVVDEVHVLNVATAPEQRRRGVARALLAELVLFSQDKGIRHVLLEVRRSNRAAIRLYRSVGFFAMGLRKRYYPDDEDAVEMVLVFDPVTRAVVQKHDEVRLEVV